MTLVEAKQELLQIAKDHGVQDIAAYQALLDQHVPGTPWPPPGPPFPPDTGSCTYQIDGDPDQACVEGVTAQECTVTLGGTFSKGGTCP
jgi:hypothetical protein